MTTVTLTIDDTTIDGTLNRTMFQRINKMIAAYFPDIASANTNKDAIRIVCENYLALLLADSEGNDAAGNVQAMQDRFTKQMQDRQNQYNVASTKAQADGKVLLS